MFKTLCVLCLCFSFIFCQVNSPCTAFNIPLGETGNATVFGSTVGGSTFYQSPCNPGVAGTSWFTVTPEEGYTVIATTCGGSTNYDTYLGVYSGSNCNELICIQGNDDSDCPIYYENYYESYGVEEGSYGYYFSYNPSTVQWVADGSEYFISISGESSYNHGKFDLSITSFNVNQGCVDAKEINGPFSSPVYINGTVNEKIGLDICRFNTFDLGTWFLIKPEPNKYMNISTCNDGEGFDTKIAIIEGDCKNSTCLTHDGSHYSSECSYRSSFIRFLPTETEYYLIIAQDNGDGIYSTGVDFALSFIQDQNEMEAGCVSAFSFHVGTVNTIYGSTIGSNVLIESSCSNEGPAVWYKVYFDYDQSQTVSFSTCNNETDFDSVISIYEGTCKSFTCIAHNSCQTSTIISANSFVYVVISGIEGETGNYKLNIDY